MQVFVDVSRFSPCTINFFRNKNICCGLKKCNALIGWFAWRGSNMAAFVAWQVVSLRKNEQQSQNLLLKVDQRSTFHNTFRQPATNVFVAGQVDRVRWKTGNMDKNLQRNNVAGQVEGFCISYFAAFSYFTSDFDRIPSKFRRFDDFYSFTYGGAVNISCVILPYLVKRTRKIWDGNTL